MKKLKKIIFPLLVFLCLSVQGMSQHTENYAGIFNGTNSYLAIPSLPVLNPPSITLETWVYPTAYGSTFKSLIRKGNSYALGLHGGSRPGRITFNPKAGSSLLSKYNSIVPLNKWTHIAASYDGNITILYINGEIDTVTFSITGPINSNSDSLLIGAISPISGHFTGLMDNVRIWSNARTFVEISNNRFIPLSPKYSSGVYSKLISSFQFDNSHSNTGGTESIASYPRNITYSNLSNEAVNYQDYNNSLNLNGITDYFRYSNNNITHFNPTTAITLEAWIRRDTTGVQPSGDQFLICKNNGGNRFNFRFWMDNTGSLKFKINEPGTIGGFQTPGSHRITNSQWNHIAATHNSVTGQARIYINGNIAASSTVMGVNPIESNSDSLFIGGITTTNQRFRGQIDEVRIWNTERTQQEIKDNMYRPVTNISPSAAIINFDQYSTTVNTGSGSLLGANLFAGSAYITSSNLQDQFQRMSPIIYSPDLYTSTYVYNNKKFYIPDNNAAGIIDSVYISDNGSVSDLKVLTLLSHKTVSNLILTLTSPSGTSRVLIGNKGGDGNDIMTIFSDAADSNASLSADALNGPGIIPPFSPGIKPDHSLSAFNGENKQGWWKLKFIDNSPGEVGYVHSWGIQASPLTGIDPVISNPLKYSLSQNYPNPFNPTTKINFSIPGAGMVKLTIYDIVGKEVKTLVNENKPVGSYSVDFTAAGLPSGVYFYKLTAGNFSEVKKMTLIK